MSGDGLVLIIGAENIDPGKAQIYEFDGTNYVQKGSDLVNFELGNTKCGSTVKISSDGHTVIYACTEGTGEATVYDVSYIDIKFLIVTQFFYIIKSHSNDFISWVFFFHLLAESSTYCSSYRVSFTFSFGYACGR